MFPLKRMGLTIAMYSQWSIMGGKPHFLPMTYKRRELCPLCVGDLGWCCLSRGAFCQGWHLSTLFDCLGLEFKASFLSNFSPPYRSQRVLQLRLSCQVAGGDGVRSPIGEVVGDHTTGGSGKKILLKVKRNQILLARTYFLCEETPGRMST